MSVVRVQAFLDERETGLRVIETGADTSTVEAAGAALGVEPARIAKTLAVRAGDRAFLLVARGDARLDNVKFRRQFGVKPRMLPADEAEALTGQPVGGVGPFGHPAPVDVYCDESLRAFDVVYPAGGSPRSAIRVTPDQLAELAGATWVDVVRPPDLSGDTTPST
jgi:prolyl-tRNA editing enzyme YbaK/EbsC (Cys-tRNA(Pro) deacylase)